MSLKPRSVRGRSPPWRAPTDRSRLRVLPLVASKTFGRSNASFDTIIRRILDDRARLRCLGGNDESATAAATDLPALAPGIPGLVRVPFMSRALFVGGTPTLAGDLALLLSRHRCEPAPFLAFSCSHAK